MRLLFASIAAWDLRLLGVAKHVPIVAFHRLVPFAVLGIFDLLDSGHHLRPADHLLSAISVRSR